ncbi:hypothetical protein UA08_09390 [Talaromyces atroroseus]|uniref:Uncharacterized protein n=1 Tax=Talaromyces atroroseus TaxID=1441469 RepID=A0A1Q5Q6K5_TALAT|nr:hypothetical protein UA08_09390 [Talaromyces atroroseus]OKL55321.1 hypothetical protein UA08_09390 [Talaromyces atroroseus]
MTLPGIIIVFIGIGCLVHGLAVSWTTDTNDESSANVTIDLFLQETFYIILTSGEDKNAVPITDLSYTFQYTPDKSYIAAQKGYIIRMYDGSASDFKSDEFEIFNTHDYVTSVPTTAIPTCTGRNSGGRLKSSSTSAPFRNLSTPTSNTPSASPNAASGLTRGDIRADTIALFTITAPLVYTLVLLRYLERHHFVQTFPLNSIYIDNDGNMSSTHTEELSRDGYSRHSTSSTADPAPTAVQSAKAVDTAIKPVEEAPKEPNALGEATFNGSCEKPAIKQDPPKIPSAPS